MAVVASIDTRLQKMRLELRNALALQEDSPGLQRLQGEIDDLAVRIDALERRPPQILRSIAGGGGASPAPVVVTPTPPARRFAALVGDGTSTSFVVTHDLSTVDVIVQVFDSASGATIECGTDRGSANAVTLQFSDPPLFNQYRVLIQA